MAKQTDIFECTNCGAQYHKWSGRCQECGKWSTVEQLDYTPSVASNATPSRAKPTETIKLREIESTEKKRVKTGITELDTVLGGGFVLGSFVLIGGEPGIGKSTLALQLANAIPKTMYFSGEESLTQIKLRADRLRRQSSSLELANTTDLDRVIGTLREQCPTIAIIDSIQTFATADADGIPGSIGQVRACTAKLMDIAKSTDTIIVLIGHVTKEGAVAGPKMLEHMVDAVLYLEGDPHHGLRLLRAVKNRFGSTDEVGIFEMRENGLSDIKDVSAKLLAERGDEAPGSIITCLIEGTRPILVEIQALVSKTSFGYPVRKASGFDLNRLHVLIAVLERRAKLNLSAHDVHLNIVGGMKADEPSADLAVCMAIISAYTDKPIDLHIAAFGEVGLAGEVRSIRFIDKRLKECSHLGIKKVYTKHGSKTDNVKIIPIKNIRDLLST